MQKFNKMIIYYNKSYKMYKFTPLLLRSISEKYSYNIVLNQKLFEKNKNKNIDNRDKKFILLNNFANIINKYTNLSESVIKSKSFSNQLRNSNFIQLGDPEGKIVTGKIFQVIKNDLYIDFGWKFHCICSKPVKNNSKYIRGAAVHIQIKDLELSTRFLGSNSDTTILEADCTLLGLIYNTD